MPWAGATMPPGTGTRGGNLSGELEKLLKRYITPDIVVKAGVLENATRAEGGASVAEYAADREYGTSAVPSSPFLRSTLDARAEAWCDNLAQALAAGRTPEEAMQLAGRRMADDIQATIKSNMPPDNAESVRRRKNARGAGKGTLIDSGSLLKSIDYEAASR